jgi:predicted HD superfamily hydrolase involved in NAD metabolism
LNLADYEAYLKNKLTPKRLEHSLGVMRTMEELALVYGLDKDQASVAGLLHDIAKELPSSHWQALMKTDGLIVRDAEVYDYHHYLHGPVGAMLAQQDLEVEDKEILGAIITHGYYGPWEQFNRPLAWCLRMADILEPGRNWKNSIWLKDIVGPLREAVYGSHLIEGASIITERLVTWYEAIGLSVHPNILHVANGLSLTH